MREGEDRYVSFTCPECNSPLMESRSGFYSQCPNGHGRLMDKLSPNDKKRNHAQIALNLPDAWEQGKYWIIPGDDRRFVLEKRITRLVNRWPKGVPKDRILALDGWVVLVLKSKE